MGEISFAKSAYPNYSFIMSHDICRPHTPFLLTESGKPLTTAISGIEEIPEDDETITYRLQSGDYAFRLNSDK